jgi:hypothetical protein
MMLPMGRPRAAWLTSLGLLGAGWVTAHVLSYLLLVPSAQRSEMLAQTGHGYFRTVDLVLLCVTVTLAGLALFVVSGKERRRSPKPWTLALLPPIGFVVQEHLERIAASGAFPAHLLAEPRFLLGLLLQIPFALAALLVAGALLTAADRLARSLAAPRLHAPTALALGQVLTPGPDLPRRSVLAAGHSQRGPPLSLSAVEI